MISNGVYWVEVPERDLRILCGCPADTTKHLMRCGFINVIERGGITYESGPNAILLSDVSIQNGDFANLAEFPVLQMLYRQGMIIPNHPNNTGARPIILGTPEQVQAQRDYIYRGNYGLVSEEEMIATGLDKATAAEYMRIKKVFAFGSIRSPEELICFHGIRNEPEEIVPGVSIERVADNTYRIAADGDYVEVCLNLDRTEQYKPSYILSQHKIKQEYFSIVHTGEGDGWDQQRPCMASIITFQERLYLIDAGPSVMHTLTALGISANQIDGIFHTHAHDDHFAGLTSMVRTDHRLRYYATPLVRASVAKKLSALMSFPEENFADYFDPRDLVEGEWNNVEGLEVKPFFSPHPVETTAMFFRALWEDGYKTYAHLADICTMKQLTAIMKDGSAPARALEAQILKNYFCPVDIKKIDAGGGMIHGDAEDFRHDQSGRIVVSHRSKPLTPREKEIGADTAFGMQDILIKASNSARKPMIKAHLRHNFPDVPEYDIEMFANCPTRSFSIGSILSRKGTQPERVYLLLHGLIEIVNAEEGVANLLTPGSMVGEIDSLMDTPAEHTYRAASFIEVLEVAPSMYRNFIERQDRDDTMREHLQRKQFLMGTFLLGDRIDGATLNTIARDLEDVHIRKGETALVQKRVLLIVEGKLAIRCKDKQITEIRAGGAVGASHHMSGPGIDAMEYVALEDTRVFRLPGAILDDIPIVRWKLLEQFHRVRRVCAALFQG
ncbi:MAG: MBL fold metallo-hydrolase [Spirochaetaceae bacterium]|nr:MAG: MBL fold metallo-hydrolase [Spirochaetaceae bacterium]